MSPFGGHGALVGRSVLIGGPSDQGRRIAEALAARGAAVELAPFIRIVPAAAKPWREAVARLAAGGYDWLIVTSLATIRVLKSQGLAIPPETRIAAIGPYTARILVESGFDVSLVPAEHSARGLLADPAFASTTGARILLPESELAPPLLADGLRALDHEVTAFVGYRIEPVPAPPHIVTRLREGGYDVLVVGSGSVGTEVVRQCGRVAEGMRIVGIGPATAEAAQDAGLRVDGYGSMRDPELLADAVEAVLEGRWSAPQGEELSLTRHDRDEYSG